MPFSYVFNNVLVMFMYKMLQVNCNLMYCELSHNMLHERMSLIVLFVL